ncbi:MAG: hypothetical protein KatS3mg096_706 [Candidatus Parcubacteria bacterium]|nr:MAG: hypothetical protein KatS3mg096_679 [Candidatus Parcubacteria bacterium]GIW67838.1 MAG: hypothetical protein KatS3mg096_706 [Candidatus Parcubacteria bacterium]
MAEYTTKDLIRLVLKRDELLILTLLFSFLIGANLNLYAVVSNDCKMPYLIKHRPIMDFDYDSNKHKPIADFREAKVYFLTDFMSIPTLSKRIYFSLGDLFLYLSIILIFIYSAKEIKKIVKKKKNKKTSPLKTT